MRAASSRPWPARMPALLVDQDRVGPAELDHRGRDLIDLRLAVRARVALVRAQPVDRPQLDPVGERDQPGALRCVGQRANLVVRRVRTCATPVAGVAAQNLRASAAFSRIRCDGWCEPRVRRGATPVRTRRSPKPGFRGFGDGANLSATGATGRFAPRGSNPGICGFRLSATGRCELRTRIRGLSLAKYRAGAPPYPFQPRKDPRFQ